MQKKTKNRHTSPTRMTILFLFIEGFLHEYYSHTVQRQALNLTAPNLRGIKQLGSTACAASSINTTLNLIRAWLTASSNTPLPQPLRVASTTFEGAREKIQFKMKTVDDG